MKNMMRYATAAALTALLGSPAVINAEEEVSYSLAPDTSYELDLQGDGTVEQVSYKTYTVDEDTGEAKAVLEIYVNDSLFWSIVDESWTYHWNVEKCPVGDGSTLLLISSISDNDWSNQSLLIKATEDSFYSLADLTLLTRESEESNDKLLSGWARISRVTETQDGQITVEWCDALKATGNILIPVTYDLKGDQITQTGESGLLDAEKEWTAWRAFDVIADPTNDILSTIAYQVEPDETVHLTEYMKLNGKFYLKCINEDGLEGWLPDAENYISEPDPNGTDYLCGYFKEAVYAG